MKNMAVAVSPLRPALHQSTVAATASYVQILKRLSQSTPNAVTLKTITYPADAHVPFPFVYDGFQWLYSQEEARARLSP